MDASKQLEIMTSNVVLHPLDILPSELEKEVEPSLGGEGKGESLQTTSCLEDALAPAVVFSRNTA